MLVFRVLKGAIEWDCVCRIQYRLYIHIAQLNVNSGNNLHINVTEANGTLKAINKLNAQYSKEYEQAIKHVETDLRAENYCL